MAVHGRLHRKPFRAFGYHIRLWLAAGLGLVFAWFLPQDWRLTTRILAGWDVGVLIYLTLAFLLVQSFDLRVCRSARSISMTRAVCSSSS